MMMSFAGEGWGEGMSRMVIDDEMWFRLEKLLPKPKGRHGEDDRLFMEAICWMLRTGTAWRDLPLDYGNRKSVYNRYNNWSKKGYITAILTELKKSVVAEYKLIPFAD
ncbi:TPA: transposase [Legionella pneumophila]|nr:transposase [Legionella pneumophila]